MLCLTSVLAYPIDPYTSECYFGLLEDGGGLSGWILVLFLFHFFYSTLVVVFTGVFPTTKSMSWFPLWQTNAVETQDFFTKSQPG